MKITKAQMVEVMNKQNELIEEQRKTLEVVIEAKEGFHRDVLALHKVIDVIGSIVIHPDWISSNSHNILIQRVSDLKMQNDLNTGMYRGMKEAHQTAIRELTQPVDNTKLDLQK